MGFTVTGLRNENFCFFLWCLKQAFVASFFAPLRKSRSKTIFSTKQLSGNLANILAADLFQCVSRRSLSDRPSIRFNQFICHKQSLFMCNCKNQTSNSITLIIHYQCMQSFQSLRTTPIRSMDNGVITNFARIVLPPFGRYVTNVVSQSQARFPSPTYYGSSLGQALFRIGPCNSSPTAPINWFRLLQPLIFHRESCDDYCI